MDLECKSLEFSFADKELFRDFNFKAKSGQQVWIRGPSGSGKSTFLSLIAGLTKIDSGEISWGQKKFSNFDQFEFQNFRRENICFVHQENHLIPHWTVAQNLQLFENFQTDDGKKKSDYQNKIQNIFADLNLSKDILKQKTESLSGGERQRISLLRCILANLPIVLLDEPTSHLDDRSAELFMNKIIKACATSTLIVVSHDNRMAGFNFSEIHFSDLKNGK